jgi:hypothetical protein
MNRIIRDFMCRGVVTCGVNTNAAEVAKIMLDNDVSTLVVAMNVFVGFYPWVRTKKRKVQKTKNVGKID